MLDLLIPTIAQGLLWSLLALGVYITFRVLDIADLSVEGTFPLGAAVAATCITSGHSLVTAFVLAVLAGCVAGAVTGLLTTKLKIPALLSGILTMIGLYSINLRVMGRANLSLLGQTTIYSWGASAGLTEAQTTLAVGLIAALLVVAVVYWFFGTEIGLALRATGYNPQMSRAQGVNTDSMVILGLLLSNGLVALSGALVGQSNGFADAGMGVGTIVIGLRYLEFRLQTERAEAFFNINIQAHAFALLARLASRRRSRRSSILTASSTTAEITMFTATHR